jgi:hypothetical protein
MNNMTVDEFVKKRAKPELRPVVEMLESTGKRRAPADV